MGVEGIDPNQVVGTYVKPEQWNDLLADPDVVLEPGGGVVLETGGGAALAAHSWMEVHVPA